MNKLIFKRLSAATSSPFVALVLTETANPRFIGVVHENDCGWGMYDQYGSLVTDVWQTPAELQKAVAKQQEVEVY